MMAELARADLGGAGRQAMKGMGYNAGKKVLTPTSHKPAGDDKHKVMEKWVQAALNVVLGTKLKLDGTLNGDTRAALMRFQRDNGLAAHGFLDERTLMALELQVGIRAPRDGIYQQTVPRLWQEDVRKAPQKPTSPEKRKELAHKPQGTAPPGETTEAEVGRKEPVRAGVEAKLAKAGAVEGGPAPAVAAEGDLQARRAKAADSFLQREAVQAVVRLALSREFAREQGARLGRTSQHPERNGEAALQAEMVAWFERAQTAAGGDAAWLQQLRTLARDRQDEAVAHLRATWQAAHPHP